MKKTTKNILGGTAMMIIGGIGTTISVGAMVGNAHNAAQGYTLVKNAVADKVKSLKAKKD